MTKPKCLIPKPEDWNVDINNSLLHQAAYFCESNLQAAGAVAGTDYNLMDCFLLGAFVYLGSKIDDMTSKINTIIPQDVDIDDGVEYSKDISDVDESKPISKAPFIIGYQ